jgi:hypothetical protein
LLRGAEQLRHLVGTRLLVGISVRSPDGALRRQEQFCGRVLEVAEGAVVVERPNAPDDPARLPADPAAYDVAVAGSYVLATTGETVVDPDYVTTWEVIEDDPDPGGQGSSG